MSLPIDKKERKECPVTTGVLDYFPDAIAEIAHVSFVGNEQHNPGEPLHWAREKSADHADCVARHLIERGKIDTDGMRHTAKAAWRILALLQLELERVSDKPTATVDAPGSGCTTNEKNMLNTLEDSIWEKVKVTRCTTDEKNMLIGRWYDALHNALNECYPREAKS